MTMQQSFIEGSFSTLASLAEAWTFQIASVVPKNEERAMIWLGLGFAAILVIVSPAIFFARRYRRCPSNRILVIFGRVGSERAPQVPARRRRVRLAAHPGLGRTSRSSRW
jgi:hypothetical protein